MFTPKTLNSLVYTAGIFCRVPVSFDFHDMILTGKLKGSGDEERDRSGQETN